MQSKNAIPIVHMMAGMYGMYKLYVCYLEHRRWTMLKYSTLLPVYTRRLCVSSFKALSQYFLCKISSVRL